MQYDILWCSKGPIVRRLVSRHSTLVRTDTPSLEDVKTSSRKEKYDARQVPILVLSPSVVGRVYFPCVQTSSELGSLRRE